MKNNEIFENNPNLDLYFETTDGTCFFTENAAAVHAKTLENKRITTVNRLSEALADKKTISPAVKSKNGEATDTAFDEQAMASKLKELETTELVKENYNALKDLVKYFKIEVADQKASTLIAALSQYKLTLQE